MPDKSNTISVTKPDYIKLKRAYDAALEEGHTSFVFQERELLVDYAKYLLQYLKPKFEDEES